MEKFCRAGQDTDDNIVHAHYVLCSAGYRQTLRICNNGSRKRINVRSTSITCLVVNNITTAHMSLIMNDRGIHYRLHNIASVICKLGDKYVLLSNVIMYLHIYSHIYHPNDSSAEA